MFDPKDLLDILVAGQSRGTAPMRERADNMGGLGDIMSDILGSAPETKETYRPSGRAAQRQPQTPPDLGDIFGDILGGGLGKSQTPRQSPSANAQEQGGGFDPSGQIKDILDQITRGSTQRRAEYQEPGRAPTGGGLGGGMPTTDILGKARDILIANPALGAAVLGGLGSLVLGTKSGRSIVGKGIKYGGMAMIGKMAWNAYKKFQEGQMAGGGQEPYQRENHYETRPDIDPDIFSLPAEPEPAPRDSGFEPQAQTGQHAVLFLRTMIAAAATDGEVDMAERGAIIDNLKQLGLDQDAMAFIEDEFNSPASVEEIANAVPDQQVAAQVYTAARITINPDTRDEVYFLKSLAQALKLPSGLVANIDHAANAAKS